jgi:spermidine/putrescine transport system permease protein
MKKAPILRLYAMGYLLVLYAPILVLPLFAFNDASIGGLPAAGLHHQMVRRDVADPQPARGAANSLIIALSTATLATVLGIFAARSSVRYRWPGKGP